VSEKFCGYGEYEVQNLPFVDDEEYNEAAKENDKPDFDFAIKEAKNKGVRVRYYPLIGGTT